MSSVSSSSHVPGPRTSSPLLDDSRSSVVFKTKERDWFPGTILFRGTKTECMTRALELEKRGVAQARSTRWIEEDTSESEDDESPVDLENEMADLRVASPCPRGSGVFRELQNSLVKPLYRRELAKCADSFDENAGIRAAEEATESSVMYNGRDLLESRATEFNKYVRETLKVLFSPEELRRGIIVECASSTKRRPLDPRRVGLLKRAVRAKFPVVGAAKSAEQWEQARQIANRKCREVATKFMSSLCSPRQSSTPKRARESHMDVYDFTGRDPNTVKRCLFNKEA